MQDVKQAKILMIEDNSQHRFLYKFQFEKSGYVNFKAVATAQEGLESIEKETPDLILLDLILAGVSSSDSLTILKRLKTTPATAQVPIIILSNKREEDMGEKVREAGAVDYILKARYFPEEVVERIGKFLINEK
jgi:CheY-like chemotaxis protein